MTSDILPARSAMDMYDPMKRHQIEVLRSAGFSLREAASRAARDAARGTATAASSDCGLPGE